MSQRFIVLAPRPRKESLLSAAGVEQLHRVRRERADSKRLNEVREWIHQRSPADVRVVDADDALVDVGAAVLETDEAGAARVREELGDAVLVEDFEMHRIVSNLGELTTATGDGDDWHLEATGVTQGRADGSIGRGAGVRVALLDSGVNQEHPEFSREIDHFAIDGGAVRDVAPGDKHSEGHGTHTAGLVAGASLGVAPDAELLALVSLADDSVLLSDLLVRWVRFMQDADPPIQIASMSLGLPTGDFDRPMIDVLSAAFDELRMAGILPIVAAGNDGQNRLRYPGALPAALSVGASTRAAGIWSSSCSGVANVDDVMVPVPDIVAPGAGVFSAAAGGGFRPAWGTSQATPIAAGIAALLLEQQPQLGLDSLQDLMVSCCEPLAQVPVMRQGAGLAKVSA